ncbi:MAG: hypothetical protein ACP5IB_07950 [Thermoplasmata archaeon]
MEEGKLHETDVSEDVDLIICIANLIKIEEHFLNSYQTTKKEEYLALSDIIRKIRGEIMKKWLEKYNLEGDDWCAIKHILSTFYGLREVAQKLISIAIEKNDEKTLEYCKLILDKSSEIYSFLINFLKEKTKK